MRSRLTGTNTYTGATLVNAGTLKLGQAGNPATILAGILTVNNGGTLAFGSYNLLGAGAPGISTTTPVVVNSGGAVDSSATVTTMSNLTLSGGNLRSTGGFSSSWGSFALLGTLSVTADSSILNVSGSNNALTPGANNGNPTLIMDVAAGAKLTNQLAITNYDASHVYSITKTGLGTAEFTASNTYSGATTVNAGTLNLTGGGSLIGTLSLITQAGGAMTIGSGTVALAANAAGVFGVGYGLAGTGTVTVNSGGVLNVGNGGGRTFVGGGPSGGPYGNGVLTINAGGTVTIAAVGAFPNDRLYLGGYGGTGTVTIHGGMLTTARDIIGASGTCVFEFNGGTLRAGFNSTTFLSGMATATIQAGGATIDTNGFGITISQKDIFGGTGSLTKIGTGTLTLLRRE